MRLTFLLLVTCMSLSGFSQAGYADFGTDNYYIGYTKTGIALPGKTETVSVECLALDENSTVNTTRWAPYHFEFFQSSAAYRHLGFNQGTEVHRIYNVLSGPNTPTTKLQFEFSSPIKDISIIISDIDTQKDLVKIEAYDENNSLITDYSDWNVFSGDMTAGNPSHADSAEVDIPDWDPSAGTLMSSQTGNANRSFTALSPNIKIKKYVLTYSAGVYGSGYHVNYMVYSKALDGQHCNYVKNGFFQENKDHWSGFKYGTAAGSLSKTNNGELKLDVTQASSSIWHFSARQNAVPLESGKMYELGFSAYTTDASPRELNVYINSASNGSNVFFSTPERIQLTNDKNIYTYYFEMTGATTSATYFNFATGLTVGETYIDHVFLRKLGTQELQNPEFSGTINNWTKVENGSTGNISLTSDGNLEAECTTCTTNSSVKSFGVQQNGIDLLANTWYVLATKVKSPQSSIVKPLKIEVLDNTWTKVYDAKEPVYPVTEPNSFPFYFKTTSTSTNMKIRLYSGVEAGSVEFESIYLAEAPERGACLGSFCDENSLVSGNSIPELTEVSNAIQTIDNTELDLTADTYFSAGKFIELNPGLVILPDATNSFTADIVGCN